MRDAGQPAVHGGRSGAVVDVPVLGTADPESAQLDQLHEEGEEPGPKHAPAVLGIYLNAGRYPAARAILRRMASHGQAAQPSDHQRLLEQRFASELGVGYRLVLGRDR